MLLYCCDVPRSINIIGFKIDHDGDLLSYGLVILDTVFTDKCIIVFDLQNGERYISAKEGQNADEITVAVDIDDQTVVDVSVVFDINYNSVRVEKH